MNRGKEIDTAAFSSELGRFLSKCKGVLEGPDSGGEWGRGRGKWLLKRKWIKVLYFQSCSCGSCPWWGKVFLTNPSDESEHHVNHGSLRMTNGH